MLTIKEMQRIKDSLSYADDEFMQSAMLLYRYFRSGRYIGFREWHPFGFMFGYLCGVREQDLDEIRYAHFDDRTERYYSPGPIIENELVWSDYLGVHSQNFG